MPRTSSETRKSCKYHGGTQLCFYSLPDVVILNCMDYNSENITFFAKTDARGQEVPFGIKAKDRTRHVYIIGKTGMGKSTLLENMAVQDIKNGAGLAFIDPHGQTAETLLNYIPESRIKDVLYFAPFDTGYPVAFNVMEDVGPDKRHLVVSGLMSVFKKIWVDAWSARMEYILSNTLLALLEYPNSTLLGVNRMLSDKEYRKLVIENISDPAVKSFWVDEFLKYNERYMQEAGDAIKNKIGQFTSNPLIRNIIGQPRSSFDIRKIMDERKIIIMNLSKGLVGESNANLLGSMLTTRIYLAAMSRADLTPEQMERSPNFYFFVDEFQSFANATFANILSEARKYKLNLTIAHQYIQQMEEEVRDAVFGNVGTIISFRVGPFDAEVLETIFAPKFTATDIVNLGFTQIYLTLMIDGIGSPPFSATTLPQIKPQVVSYKQVVIAESRRRHAVSRQEVELIIHEFHKPVVREDKPRRERKERFQTDDTMMQKKDIRPATTLDGQSKRTENIKKPPLEPNKARERTRALSGSSNTNPNLSAEEKVEELRLVLRSITKDGENKTANKKETDHVDIGRKNKTVNEADTSKKDNTQTDLKEALAIALSDVGGFTSTSNDGVTVTAVEQKEGMAPDTFENEKNKSPKDTFDEVENKTHLVSKQSPINTSVAEPTLGNQSSADSDKDDPLSPKRLEKMLRTTGKDRPPL